MYGYIVRICLVLNYVYTILLIFLCLREMFATSHRPKDLCQSGREFHSSKGGAKGVVALSRVKMGNYKA